MNCHKLLIYTLYSTKTRKDQTAFAKTKQTQVYAQYNIFDLYSIAPVKTVAYRLRFPAETVRGVEANDNRLWAWSQSKETWRHFINIALSQLSFIN